MDRRDFIGSAARAGLLLGGWGLAARAVAQAASGGVTATDLRGGLLQFTGAGGNVVGLRAGDGVVLVDSGAPDRAAELLKLADQRFGGAPVQLLFNTHWHLEHTGGNDAIGAAGAKIVAHENTRLWMSIDYYIDWQDRTYPARAPEALPTETFFSSDPQPIEHSFGGERIVYGHLREAHTDGDIYVHFPDRNVIAAGGAVTVGEYPVLDYITGGWIGGLIDATSKLIDMSDDETLIVPQSGPAQKRDYLTAQKEMLETVQTRIEEMAHQGKGIDDMVAANITAEFDARWGSNSELFLSNAYKGMWWGGRMRGIVA
ncbi:MAG: MBL fold metallo-hydrolase [Gammaproteobacteria bacterium]|nr:MBL fold metallo-hydrolase [Gammaproteobacteria bacterium]